MQVTHIPYQCKHWPRIWNHRAQEVDINAHIDIRDSNFTTHFRDQLPRCTEQSTLVFIQFPFEPFLWD